MKNKVFTILILFVSSITFAQSNKILRFDLGSGLSEVGYQKVTSSQLYDSSKGFGFTSNGKISGYNYDLNNKLTSDGITADAPFYFHTNVPEGNYKVTIIFGDIMNATKTTVKAESRRVMLHNVETQKGQFDRKSCMVSVRSPKISDTLSIGLNKREYPYLNWDNKLSLEFLGEHPAVCAIEIEKVENIKTIFLAGNSTVVDQEYVPWAAWGQVFPMFFTNEVVVANYAESGQAMKSFEWTYRLQKLLSQVKPGDYVFIQFGHNDQKPESSAYIEANTTYKDYLKKYVKLVREKGGNPLLISSMHRRKFDENGQIIQTHGDYPEAVHEVATEVGVPFIDLNSMSEALYESLGEEGSKKLFVHYAANTFPNQSEALADNSHHSMYGATQLAKCIVQGIIDNELDLVNYLNDPEFSYSPSNPDKFEEFDIPQSVIFQGERPLGD